MCPPHQALNRAVTVTASLPSLQGCCLPKGSAVTYICQALLALSASENHFSLNFIAVYPRVFSSFVWFELWAPSRGFDEGNLVCSGGGELFPGSISPHLKPLEQISLPKAICFEVIKDSSYLEYKWMVEWGNLPRAPSGVSPWPLLSCECHLKLHSPQTNPYFICMQI